MPLGLVVIDCQLDGGNSSVVQKLMVWVACKFSIWSHLWSSRHDQFVRLSCHQLRHDKVQSFCLGGIEKEFLLLDQVVHPCLVVEGQIVLQLWYGITSYSRQLNTCTGSETK